MLAQVRSCAIVGLEGALVEVEVDLTNGLAGFTIVGLADTAIQEARERVRAAIKNSGAVFPYKRITVNLAPADLRKEGPVYDLPIAIGILLASGQLVPVEPISDCLFLGELSLDGSVRHTNGMLPMVALAREHGMRTVFVPAVDAREAALVSDISVYAVETLAQLIAHLSGEVRLAPFPLDEQLLQAVGRQPPSRDLAAVRGQDHVKRALEVAVSGGHNLLMCGPPGTGKTLLARATPSIMPPLSIDEALDVTRIYSVSGLLPSETPLILERPFRSPHHTISHAGLVGGGRQPRPGEISLAHRGVLFLDELPEFSQYVLEALRQPLEDKVVTISRAQGSVTFPANFMLIAAMNPCPCGYLHDVTRECKCSPAAVRRYQKRVSGPLLDRIDIQVEVPRVAYEKLAGAPAPESTERIRARVQAARERQRRRFAGTRLTCNAEMGAAEVQAFCYVDEAGQRLLRSAVQQLALSARAFHRMLKVARTIADLEGAERIGPAHVAEAVQYRPRIAP
ncbi:YifB family Mg chelatase-like AAA ATPase [Thermogemmatispora sp.]|uniref:YifB family Mg chelatase-like AAA ATPase n=1 Tax=Thermogemmatispora sp. TaxID=1968838 RepID=UPI001D6300AF|nr:YifB family Mg chelatase-like AAA ATPase [Thermogemmatispora sp.]MBX5448875.1 YifB family Mg chelatase-like AAA ATPase [Thermogemmatispora sp.]